MQNHKLLLFPIAILLFVSCGKQELIIPFNNPLIKYWGRVDTFQNDGAKIFWSGSTIEIAFEGETLSALLSDSKGDNYYNIIVNGEFTDILRPDTTMRYHQLAAGLGTGIHSVKLFKRTEWDRGSTKFMGYKITGKRTKIVPLQTKTRNIEFYGNSVTAGYAVEDTSGKDSPDSIFTNNYLSYSAITARHFNAVYSCICRSGIGITISWFPETMPEIYDRLNPEDPFSKWDFQLFTPDVVVVNLLQNDAYLISQKNFKEYKARFGDKDPDENFIIQAYAGFIESIRSKYPQAHIICMLGNMSVTKEGSLFPGYVKAAVSQLNDKNLHTLVVPYKQTRGHPSINEQQVLADSLIAYIGKNINW